LAASYRQVGEVERAVALLETAVRYFHEVGQVRSEANGLANYSVYLSLLGRLPEALKSSQAAVTLSHAEGFESTEAHALHNLGGIQFGMGQFKAAKDTYEQALTLWNKLGNRRQEGLARIGLGRTCAAIGQRDRGRELFNQALLGARAIGDRTGELNALLELAKVERALGDMTGARRHIDGAIEIQETTRRELLRDDWRSSFGGKSRDSYEFAVDLRMAMNRATPDRALNAEALSFSERARARTLVELLSRAGVDPEQGADAGLIKRRREIETELKAQAEKQLRLITGVHSPAQVEAGEVEAERLTQQLRDVQAKIWATARNEVSKQPETLTGLEIRRLLDDDTTLLEYWFAKERSYVWLVTSSSVQSYELPPESEVEKVARRAYNQLKSRGGASDAIRTLGQLILHPVIKHLNGRRLVIIADGALQYIPFGALPLPSGEPVVSRFEVVNLPSASALAVVRREREGREAPPKLAAVLADPVYTRDDPRVSGSANASALRAELVRSVQESGLVDLNRLPATRVEAAILRKLTGGQEFLEAIGFEANRDTVLNGTLGDYRILHFATHGLVNSLHPELSGLVLSLVDSEGKPRDGFLQAHEIYALKLRADLTVLSACQTALGKEVRGEGLMSLTRAFMAAGVPRVVASLWSVPDAATAELMKRFYRGVISAGLAPSSALRQAQNSLRRDRHWSAPYYWAAFTLQGDWN
jgi:CHAT domain-containing protein/tetratricopeptide (TPR) repeat protein